MAIGGLLLLLLSDDSLAKLVFRTEDVYVRQADVVVVADTVATGMRGGVPVATVLVHSVLMGAVRGSTLCVRDFPAGEEDMPRFKVGERSLLFLSPIPALSGVFSSVGAQATKRVYRSERTADWAAALERIGRLVAARQQPDEKARVAALVLLLESDDSQLAAAASNYLNYLATGQQDEEWIVNPPEGSSDWSWKDYFERNVVAHRRKWQAWWRAKESAQ